MIVASYTQNNDSRHIYGHIHSTAHPTNNPTPKNPFDGTYFGWSHSQRYMPPVASDWCARVWIILNGQIKHFAVIVGAAAAFILWRIFKSIIFTIHMFDLPCDTFEKYISVFWPVLQLSHSGRFCVCVCTKSVLPECIGRHPFSHPSSQIIRTTCYLIICSLRPPPRVCVSLVFAYTANIIVRVFVVCPNASYVAAKRSVLLFFRRRILLVGCVFVRIRRTDLVRYVPRFNRAKKRKHAENSTPERYQAI